jgi:hypothetical protein
MLVLKPNGLHILCVGWLCIQQYTYTVIQIQSFGCVGGFSFSELFATYLLPIPMYLYI